MPPDPLPVLCFESIDAWDAWLAAHHAGSARSLAQDREEGGGGHAPSPTPTPDVALCHGWIDGQKGRHDDDYWLQRFTAAQARQQLVERSIPSGRRR
jgi:uncharacterized protein YdeI (YjbR/CyaY-like superfamily)